MLGPAAASVSRAAAAPLRAGGNIGSEYGGDDFEDADSITLVGDQRKASSLSHRSKPVQYCYCASSISGFSTFFSLVLLFFTFETMVLIVFAKDAKDD